MATPAEIACLARDLAAGCIEVDAVLADGELTSGERRDVLALALHTLRCRAQRRGQRRACGLLRSLLSPAQRAEWRRRKTLTVVGSAGGRYRLYPASGGVWRLERHGRYEIGVESFCLHDPERQVPPADESIGHLLRLVTDEPAFRALANAQARQHMGWDGAWHRRLAAARRERSA